MDYAGALAYLYGQLPMFHRVGKAAYKADLRNTHALMELLGHPERGLRCVHVAGTNGKGSTSHLLASVLHCAGYRTGLYTSPHLKDFRERIRIDGAMIPERAVVRFVERSRDAFAPITPSFFEWTVALAFQWFREEQVDIAVIETGLGGRLDSTNVVVPDVSVITNIGWDHSDLLGPTVEHIAAEKAGIMKSGVPVVIGEAEGAVARILHDTAATVGAPIIFVDPSAPLRHGPGLVGAHQERNARTALAALEALRSNGWRIAEDAVGEGFRTVVERTGLRGRWEIIGQDPLTIADVGHNEDGLRMVRQQVERTPHHRLHIVLGTVNDKDIARMLAQLPAGASYHFCKADLPRGLAATELAARARAFGLSGIVHPSVRAALAAARQAARPGDLVLVTGSVFVVAEVL